MQDLGHSYNHLVSIESSFFRVGFLLLQMTGFMAQGRVERKGTDNGILGFFVLGINSSFTL